MRGDTPIATNDDWGANAEVVAQAAGAVGAFPLQAGSRDAATVVELPAGNYTVLVSGAGDSTGVALVEVYELDR